MCWRSPATGFGKSPTNESGASYNPWEFWDAATIARVTQCPVVAVTENWPAIHAALKNAGQGSKNSQAGALGTIAIETASTFEPVREAFWLTEAWRKANLRYYPYYGRGYIQLTWSYNYGPAGTATGIDLLTTPDLAMVPGVAALVFAWYWGGRDIQAMCDRKDWTAARKAVQGADAGLDRLMAIARSLVG